MRVVWIFVFVFVLLCLCVPKTDAILNCGNGVIDSGEQCDDGNNVAKDGCTFCNIDIGYVCSGQPSKCTCKSNFYPTPDGCSYCLQNDTCNAKGTCYIDGSCACAISTKLIYYGDSCQNTILPKSNFSSLIDPSVGGTILVQSTATDFHKLIFAPKGIVSAVPVTISGVTFAADAIPVNQLTQPFLTVASDIVVFDSSVNYPLFTPAEFMLIYPFSQSWAYPPTSLRIYRFEFQSRTWIEVPNSGVDVALRVVHSDQIPVFGVYAVCNNSISTTTVEWTAPAEKGPVPVTVIAILFFACFGGIIGLGLLICFGKKAYFKARAIQAAKELAMKERYDRMTKRTGDAMKKLSQPGKNDDEEVSPQQDEELGAMAKTIAKQQVENEIRARDDRFPGKSSLSVRINEPGKHGIQNLWSHPSSVSSQEVSVTSKPMSLSLPSVVGSTQMMPSVAGTMPAVDMYGTYDGRSEGMSKIYRSFQSAMSAGSLDRTDRDVLWETIQYDDGPLKENMEVKADLKYTNELAAIAETYEDLESALVDGLVSKLQEQAALQRQAQQQQETNNNNNNNSNNLNHNSTNNDNTELPSLVEQDIDAGMHLE